MRTGVKYDFPDIRSDLSNVAIMKSIETDDIFVRHLYCCVSTVYLISY